jgi:outer membrane receptor protein involved in Fe transport
MKTPIRIVTVMLALAMSLFTMSAAAQTSTTGSIEGTVVDVNGAAVPGVTITVAGQNLIRPQSATSNDEGFYRILNLPPGRYTVTIESARGFARYEQANVEVNLSKTSTIAVTLQPQGAAETVEVTASSGAAVDVTTTTSGTNVSTEQFSNFPTQRTVQSLYTIAPSVARSGLRDASGRDRDPSVAGASGPENNYILDGVTTTDPAYGGGGANLPFEFVQEIEIKTGAFGAEYGKATGGIFNVITKSGGNEFRGDVFGYFTTKGMVRDVKNFSNSGASASGFSEVDAGFDIGGPIVKDKLWFFGAFNPQRRNNFYVTQTLRQEVENEVTTPFYAGKITYAPGQNHTFTFSTFGDFTTLDGFIIAQTGVPSNGFGADPNSFIGTTKSGGHNYAFRLNSTLTPQWIAELSFGLHFQRFDRTAADGFEDRPAEFDRFAILAPNGSVAPVVQSGQFFGGSTGFVDYSYVPGGSLTRTFFRGGYAPIFTGTENRDRWEVAARFQNIWGKHTFKYGFEYIRNLYDINNTSTGPSLTFNNPGNLPLLGPLSVNGFRIDRRFLVCTTRGNQIVCPTDAGRDRAALVAAQAGFSGGAITAPITVDELQNNPFLIRNLTRIRDFNIIAETHTNTESFYIQDDFKLTRNLSLLLGLRWDYQQAFGKEGEGEPLRFNNFKDNLQPRLGFVWDYTGEGRGKIYANFARYIETPIPLDINVRALSDTAQTDVNLNLETYDAVNGANVRSISGFGALNLGHEHTPPDPDLKPQDTFEWTAGIEYSPARDFSIGLRGVYRAQDTVIEDGSFDDGNSYFLFNPGESLTDRIAAQPPAFDENGDPIFGDGIGGIGQSFGRARRYYRALELSATKRFSDNYQFIASYTYSSLIGNYEGLFRNDNGQADPNITSLFDLVSLLGNTYGRLPNDRPHQFKFDGSYRWPFKLLTSASFRAQSGIPINQLIPHEIYGDNEGFGVPRGSAGRTPTTYNLDLGAYYPINLGETRQLRFTADWFNVFNSQRAIRVDETFEIGSGVAGVPNVPNPFYGTGTIFQFPSAVRLGVKFQF